MASECSVCLREYANKDGRKPKLLPCSHTVCISCLKLLVKEEEVQCPECRDVSDLPEDGPDAYPTNRYMLDYLYVLQLVRKADKKEERNAKTAETGEETKSHESAKQIIGEPSQPFSEPDEISEVQFEAECGLPLCTPCRMTSKHQDNQYGNGQVVLNVTPRDEGNSGQTEHTINDWNPLSVNQSVRITQDNYPNTGRNTTKIYKKGRRSSNGCHRRRCYKCCAIRFALVFLWVIAVFLWGYIIISKMPNYQIDQLFKNN